MMKKGTTFPELMIVLLIVSVGLFVFSKMTIDYMKSVVMSRELFVLNSALQEKYQLLIAYRNKWLERDFSPEGPPSITDWFSSGNYCINFSGNQILLTPGTNCTYSFINNQLPGVTYQILIRASPNQADITLNGELKKFGLKSTLEGILTKWHPFFQ